MSDSNFRSFATALASDYAEQALMNFAMEFENAYEGFYDETLEMIEGGKEIYTTIINAARGLYDDKAASDEIRESAEKLRNELIDRMEILTAYSDYFSIHEYILNRIELRYGEELPETDNDEEAKKLLQFIFEPEDNMEVNLRIKEMIAQLPVRMTSNRFFDLLSESLTVYKGSERESLNSHIYMLRSAAGLLAGKDKRYFSEIADFVKQFDEIDYKNIDEATYNEYASLLDRVSGRLLSATEFVMSAMETVNDLTACYVVGSYVTKEPAVKQDLKTCILNLADKFEKFIAGTEAEAPDLTETAEIFGKLEGRPEKLSAKIAAAEGRLESFKDKLDGEDTLCFYDLECAGKLLSSSEFVRIDEAADLTEVSREMLDETAAKLETELKNCFEGKAKLVKRAVMASVLKELPVFFVSHTEVMNYVRFTLDNCKDNAEKTASLRLFRKVYE